MVSRQSEVKYLIGYIEKIAPLLGLHGYEFSAEFDEFEDEGEDLQVYACCDPSDRYRKARITVNKAIWPKLNREQRKRLVIHELLHCHTFRLDDYIKRMLRTVMGTTANPLLGLVERDAEEMIENLALAFARFLPPYPSGPKN